MNVFMMLGYNLPKELSNSYNSQLKKDLPFNYIAMVKMSDKDDQTSLEEQIEHFSKIRIRNGIMCKFEKNKLKTDVTVGAVKNADYYYKYSLKKGQQIDKLKKNEIVISDVFAEKNTNLNVENQIIAASDYYQYLLKRKSVSSIKNVENTLFIGVNNIADAMLGLLDGYVNMLNLPIFA